MISISGLEPSSVEYAGGETTHTVYGGPDNDNRLFLETDIGGELFGEGGNDYLSSQFGGTLDGGEGDDIIETLGGSRLLYSYRRQRRRPLHMHNHGWGDNN